jgi:hypothetical protein
MTDYTIDSRSKPLLTFENKAKFRSRSQEKRLLTKFYSETIPSLVSKFVTPSDMSTYKNP